MLVPLTRMSPGSTGEPLTVGRRDLFPCRRRRRRKGWPLLEPRSDPTRSETLGQEVGLPLSTVAWSTGPANMSGSVSYHTVLPPTAHACLPASPEHAPQTCGASAHAVAPPPSPPCEFTYSFIKAQAQTSSHFSVVDQCLECLLGTGHWPPLTH